MALQKRKRRQLPGVHREDSDDELGSADIPWTWMYDEKLVGDDNQGGTTKRHSDIVGARLGNFQCRIGDTVLLKAEGQNEAWVAIICDFQEREEEEKVANFMWFSSESEIRNTPKKRHDFRPVRLGRV